MMRKITMCTAIGLLSFACQARPTVTPAPVSQGAREESLDIWATNHPEASRELGNWVQKHPEAAEQFFRWDSKHAGAAKSFVTWSITHPGSDIDEFALTHRGWDVFNTIMERHHGAADAFMKWCRKHPNASESLMNHPGGLHWAGTHLYQAYWDMKRSGL